MIRDEYRPLDSLLPDPQNYNRHAPESIATLAGQIMAVGFTAPFLVDEKTGLIAAGHRRRLALLKLRADNRVPDGVQDGWLVPCRVGEWSEVQRLKVLVGDNPDPARLEYDTEALTAILADLNAQGELDGSGYDASRLDALISELAGEAGGGGEGSSGLLPDAEPDAVPDSAPARVESGDLWSLGEHRILCGDSTNPQNVERLLQGRKVDCMLTDPPYGLGDTASVKNNYDLHEDTRENLKEIIAAIIPIGQQYAERIVLTPGNGNQWLYPEPSWIMAWFTPAGVGRGPWGFCCWQPILCYGKDPRLQHGEGCHPDALSHTEAAEKLGHPCSKPVKFWTWLMERATAKGGDIFEPFSGSGTAFIAAEELGRKVYGMELSPKYADIILARWERATGKTAELLERIEA